MACKEYDNNNALPPNFYLNKKTKNTHPPKKRKKTTKKASALAQSPEERANQHAKSQQTSIRMTLIPSPGAILHDKDNELLNRFQTLDVESDSDEGSNMEDTAACLPQIYNIDQDETIPDNSYNFDLMENDSTYETNHVWTYEDLKEELPRPMNFT